MKICKICQKEIKSKDNYVKLSDYKNGKLFQEGCYHNICYHNQINNAIAHNLNKLKEQLPNIINKLKGIQYE